MVVEVGMDRHGYKYKTEVGPSLFVCVWSTRTGLPGPEGKGRLLHFVGILDRLFQSSQKDGRGGNIISCTTSILVCMF